MLGKKKMCLIVKSEMWYGISLWVNEDFDEEHESPVMKKILRDFPKDKRKVILPTKGYTSTLFQPKKWIKESVIKI